MRKTREVALIVHRAERVLVVRRTRDGHWNVPAGQVEDGETEAEAAARELMEEAALAAPLRDLGAPQAYAIDPAYRHLYPADARSVTILSFEAEAPPGWEPVLNEEHDAYWWCTFDEAVEILHFDEMKTAVRRLAQRVRSRP